MFEPNEVDYEPSVDIPTTRRSSEMYLYCESFGVAFRGLSPLPTSWAAPSPSSNDTPTLFQLQATPEVQVSLLKDLGLRQCVVPRNCQEHGVVVVGRVTHVAYTLKREPS